MAKKPQQEKKETSRPYQCDFCLKSFYRLEHKVRHVRTHTGEKPHVCTYKNCDKKFARSDELSRHLKVHTSPPSVLLQRRRRLRKFSSSKSKSVDDEEAYIKQQQFCSILRFIHPSINTVENEPEPALKKKAATPPKRSSPYKQSNAKLNHCPIPTCYKSFWRKGQLTRHIEKQHNLAISIEELEDPVRLNSIVSQLNSATPTINSYASSCSDDSESLESFMLPSLDSLSLKSSQDPVYPFSPQQPLIVNTQSHHQQDIRLPSIQSLLLNIF